MKYNDYPLNGNEVYHKLCNEYEKLGQEKVEVQETKQLNPLGFLKQWQHKNKEESGQKNVIMPQTTTNKISEGIIFEKKNKNLITKINTNNKFGEIMNPKNACQIFELELDAKLSEVFEDLKKSESYLVQIQKRNNNNQITTQDFSSAIEKTKSHREKIKAMCGCDMYFDDCCYDVPYYPNYRNCVRDYCSNEFNLLNTLLFLMLLKGSRLSSTEINSIVSERINILKIPFSFL